MILCRRGWRGRGLSLYRVPVSILIQLTGELYPSPQILDVALDGPTVRVVDEEIRIGLLAHGQIVQAADPLANHLRYQGLMENGHALWFFILTKSPIPRPILHRARTLSTQSGPLSKRPLPGRSVTATRYFLNCSQRYD